MRAEDAAKQRDNHSCIKCGCDPSDNQKLHAHHIVPSSKGGEDSLENLATLCVTCHGFAPDHDTVVVSDEMYREAFRIYNGTMTTPFVDLASFGAQLNDEYGFDVRNLAVSGMMDTGEALPKLSKSNWWAILATLCDYEGFRDAMSEEIAVEEYVSELCTAPE